jgi:hypothetical protein
VGNIEVWPYVQTVMASQENAMKMRERSNGMMLHASVGFR